MSRHTITVRCNQAADHQAIIGYDPPLATYFLQAFPHSIEELPTLWLGTDYGAYPTLDDLIAGTQALGFAIEPPSREAIAEMAAEAARPARPRLVGKLGLFR